MVMVVKVEGEARVRDGSNLTTKFYEREFEINDVGSESVARSLIRKTLLIEDLKRTLDGFKSVRTMEVVGMDEKKGKKNKEDVSRLEELMAKAIQLNAVPDGLDQYGSSKAKEDALERSIAKKQKSDSGSGAKKRDDGVEDLGYID